MVGNDTEEASDRCRCSHRRSARAARINSLVISGPKTGPLGIIIDASGIDGKAIIDDIPDLVRVKKVSGDVALFEKSC